MNTKSKKEYEEIFITKGKISINTQVTTVF